MSGQGSTVTASRLLIIDDHRMFVDSLVRLLDDESDLAVIAVAHTLGEAIQSVRVHHPDVVLLDFRFPDGDAPGFIDELRDVAPDTRVLVMTGLADDTTMAAIHDSGCAGVVTKDRAAQDLVDEIRAVASATRVTEIRAAPTSRGASGRAGNHPLSSREREVLVQLAAGQSTEEIADILHISRVTVRNHIQRILTKLDARSRLEAVATALRAGIIASPPPTTTHL